MEIAFQSRIFDYLAPHNMAVRIPKDPRDGASISGPFEVVHPDPRARELAERALANEGGNAPERRINLVKMLSAGGSTAAWLGERMSGPFTAAPSAEAATEGAQDQVDSLAGRIAIVAGNSSVGMRLDPAGKDGDGDDVNFEARATLVSTSRRARELTQAATNDDMQRARIHVICAEANSKTGFDFQPRPDNPREFFNVLWTSGTALSLVVFQNETYREPTIGTLCGDTSEGMRVRLSDGTEVPYEFSSIVGYSQPELSAKKAEEFAKDLSRGNIKAIFWNSKAFHANAFDAFIDALEVKCVRVATSEGIGLVFRDDQGQLMLKLDFEDAAGTFLTKGEFYCKKPSEADITSIKAFL